MRLALIIFFIAGATATAAAKPAPRVAVIPQLAVNIDDHRAQALTGELAESLSRRLVVDAVGGIDAVRRLPPAGLPEDCVARPACVRDVGHRLDAEQLLFVVLIQVGSDIQLDITWVEVASARSLSRPRVVLEAEARAATIFDQAAPRLLPDAEVRDKPLADPRAPVSRRARRRQITTPAWISAGVSVVFLGTGLALGNSARKTYHDCEKVPCSDSELASLALKTRLADVSFLLSFGAAITTGVLYWQSGKDEGGIGVTASSSGAGVTYTGRF